MPRSYANPRLESVIQVDKDCHPSKRLEGFWVVATVDTFKNLGVTVEKIQRTRTTNGNHYYISITPEVHARVANQLQFLAGDDARRVGFNEARLCAGLQKFVSWNLLFEPVGKRRVTIYTRKEPKDANGGRPWLTLRYINIRSPSSRSLQSPEGSVSYS